MSSSGRKPSPRPRRRPAARPEPTSVHKGALRVVAGSLRGRRFDVAAGTGIRPTSDRVREATANALDSLGAINGARVLDAFAGSGALGIEALSRGAEQVTFAETDPIAREVLEANLVTLGVGDRAAVLATDGQRAAIGGESWDLALLDPPYAFERWAELLGDVVAHLAAEGIVVIESNRDIDLAAGLHHLRVKAYGSTVVAFASPTGAPL